MSLIVDMNKISFFSIQNTKMWSEIPYIVLNIEKGADLGFDIAKSLSDNLRRFGENTPLKFSVLYDPDEEIKKASSCLLNLSELFYESVSDPYQRYVSKSYEEIRLSMGRSMENLETAIFNALSRIEYILMILYILIFVSVVVGYLVVLKPLISDLSNISASRNSMVKLEELKTIKFRKRSENDG